MIAPSLSDRDLYAYAGISLPVIHPRTSGSLPFPHLPPVYDLTADKAGNESSGNLKDHKSASIFSAHIVD
jgi:hypothetical protein